MVPLIRYADLGARFYCVFAVSFRPTLVVLHPDSPFSFIVEGFPPGVAGIEERLSLVIRRIIRRRQSRNPFHFREVHCQPPGIEVISELFERAKPYVLLTRVAPLIVSICVYRGYILQRIRIDPRHHLYLTRAASFANKDTRLLRKVFLVLSSNSTRNVLDQQPPIAPIESDIESSGSTAQVRCNTSAPHFPHARSPCAEDRAAFFFAPAIPHIVEIAVYNTFISFHRFVFYTSFINQDSLSNQNPHFTYEFPSRGFSVRSNIPNDRVCRDKPVRRQCLYCRRHSAA